MQLFRTENDFLIQEITSDATGNFSFQILAGGPFYIVAYKVGAPDVGGTTINTLVGA